MGKFFSFLENLKSYLCYKLIIVMMMSIEWYSVFSKETNGNSRNHTNKSTTITSLSTHSLSRLMFMNNTSKN